ncbi:cation transporter [Noviherbaspirillum autotrophicum]|nr:cation transporter [Noviherbaspirillum autotrophicum]HJW57263.1 cation transporter [Burkholderiaceae bacterium]
MAIAFIANIAMFLTGMLGWYLAHSTALMADAFDMLADASGYIVTWLVIGRTKRFHRHAAQWNGAMLMVLGAGVLIDVIHHVISGSEPHGLLIFAFASLSLLVNSSVLAMLSGYRNSEQVHLKATWIDTRADVIVNVGVLVSGILVAVSGYRQIDWIAGLAIGAYVIHEGREILEEAGKPELEP